MAVILSARQGGVWREIHTLSAKQGGVWRDIDTMHARQGGVHRLVFEGCDKPTVASWTLTIGFDVHIKTYDVLTFPHYFHYKSVSNSARGFDLGLDYYYHAPSFGSLNGTGGAYSDHNCVDRIVTSSYFVDTFYGARTTYLVIDTPGGVTPDNDDVFREFTVGTETLDRTTGGQFRSTGVRNTSGRYWRFLGTDSPHGTSGTTTFTLRYGP